jgi:hypothetical protein
MSELSPVCSGIFDRRQDRHCCLAKVPGIGGAGKLGEKYTISPTESLFTEVL